MSLFPSGPVRIGNRWRFSLYAPHAHKVSLLTPAGEFPMISPPSWSVDAPCEGPYAFKVDGTIVPDPFSRELTVPLKWGAPRPPLQSLLPREVPFNWQGVESPRLPFSSLILYELHVRGFTIHPSSGVQHPGTFLGLIEKIPYLKELGINAVELLPIFEWDETRSKHPPLPNYWGYNPISFFAPMRRFAVQDALLEFKQLVRELHRNGIEVILDVVYNHTGEGRPTEPTVCLRGIDPELYYFPFPPDTTGCGNALRAYKPAVQHLILESLRYFAREMRVDGFRFDLASTLTRGPDGQPLPRPPLFDAIFQDPLLKTKKWIAEPWDAGFLYQPGFFAHTFGMHEWNDTYRRSVRRFLKGTDGLASDFATALTAFGQHSINYITSHDGFTLRDLVTYQQKHNEANGENNADGADDNENWNCGFEGPHPNLEAFRKQQMENHLIALAISEGVPMIRMGDEVGHSAQGNNNPYVQDNELNWLIWGGDPSFLKKLLTLRKKYLKPGEIHWLNGWEGRFVSLVRGDLWAAFNASHLPQPLTLPPGKWDPKPPAELPPYTAFLAVKNPSL